MTTTPLTGWDEQRAARIRAMAATVRRMAPSSETGSWVPDEWWLHHIQVRQIAERFGLLWPITPGEYSKGAFTEAMLWRPENRQDRIPVLFYGIEVGWVPEQYREWIVRRMPHVQAGTKVVMVPARLWVSKAGEFGLTIEA